MIQFQQVSVTYPGSTGAALRDVDLRIPEGELHLVIGSTGSGKSTLLAAACGLVPHFTGGTLRGRVTVAGRDTRTNHPRELADVVGVVQQDPVAGFVTDTIEDELAYAMEQLAVPGQTMRRRVEEILDVLGLAELRHRALRDLSGGQQQRVAIGSVLTAGPRVLILDEPTSALDPQAAEEVFAAINRLVHDLGITVLMAEHRLERVIQYADGVVHLGAGGCVTAGSPREVMSTCELAPPVVELARLAGWKPLPLSVRDARRRAAELRERLPVLSVHAERWPRRSTGAPALTAEGLTVTYGDIAAVRDIDLRLNAGEVCALMGRNGAGKSSLLWALQGSGRRHAGSVLVAGKDPARLTASEARRLVGLVPQTPGDLLYLDTVDDECRQADAESGAPSGATRALLDRIAPDLRGGVHPRDLSEGQRLSLVLAIQLVVAPPVVLLDEPTRGLDYRAKRRFVAVLRDLAAEGRAVVVCTHDIELVAVACDRVVMLAEGEVVGDGATRRVATASPGFAPQVAKVLHPEPWLTVDEVRSALSVVPA
ncbi:MAG TPA: ATP-binding cassette domain-containing protein [Actinomycetales bacterium]|nr:ATP-binding cassette domain-containing protein [Actinomycetales bacterium]